MSETILTTPLHAAHVARGGRMVPFAGYDMPVYYASIIAEAKSVREAAGMFDVSHMARLTIRGASALAFLREVLSSDVDHLTPNVGQYCLILNNDGGTVDDAIVYKISDVEFFLVVNASNHDKDVTWLKSHLPSDVELMDVTDQTAMIAVQGPKAVAIIAYLSTTPEIFTEAPTFGVVRGTVAGVEIFGARSGYTGEDGYELIGPADQAEALWTALETAGVAPCGLGSRDTLRVEAGLPLYGHELNDELSPIAAGLGWAIRKTGGFIGADHVASAREKGTARRLVGVKLAAKRLIPGGSLVFSNGEPVGEISSGVVSPTLDCAIAMAFVDKAVALKSEIEVELRGKREPGVLVNKRFLRVEK